MSRSKCAKSFHQLKIGMLPFMSELTQNHVDKVKDHSFVCQRQLAANRGINRFVRLLGLNRWLSRTCPLKGIDYIDNFNLLWGRRRLLGGRWPSLKQIWS